MDLSLPAARIIRVLERIIEWRGRPQALRLDNGPEHLSQIFRQWAEDRGIQLRFIQPGKPAQNAYVERFNRTVRHEWLNLTIFESIAHAQETATRWLWPYNAQKAQHRYRRNNTLSEAGDGHLNTTSACS